MAGVKDGLDFAGGERPIVNRRFVNQAVELTLHPTATDVGTDSEIVVATENAICIGCGGRKNAVHVDFHGRAVIGGSRMAPLISTKSEGAVQLQGAAIDAITADSEINDARVAHGVTKSTLARAQDGVVFGHDGLRAADGCG